MACPGRRGCCWDPLREQPWWIPSPERERAKYVFDRALQQAENENTSQQIATRLAADRRKGDYASSIRPHADELTAARIPTAVLDSMHKWSTVCIATELGGVGARQILYYPCSPHEGGVVIFGLYQ